MTATLVTPSTASVRAKDAAGTGDSHGDRSKATLFQVIIAEAVGTFVLVLAIISAAIAATLAKPIAGVPFGSLTIPLAGGIALVFLVASLGQISGAHLNPAVTLGLALNRTVQPARVPAYVLSQLGGATSAALVAWWIYGPQARAVAHLGATQPAGGVSAARVFGVEAVGTFVLVLIIVVVAARASSSVAPFAIGSALAAAIIISGPVSGAGVNPARAIGPMIVAGTFTDWWAYLAAPLIGGALAAIVSTQLASRETF
jgi:aquaporin Z/aquaporin NIP